MLRTFDLNSIKNVPGRVGVLRNHDFFMAVAALSAKQSPDPNTQVGACIVKNSRVVATGFNQFPKNGAGTFSWARGPETSLDAKYLYVVHAEVDAILGASWSDIRGSQLFVTLFPCNECAKLIVQSGVKEVIYLSDKHKDRNPTIASKRMLDAAKIAYIRFKSTDGQDLDINVFIPV